MITKNTKTDQSRRIVDLNDYTIKLLKDYKVWQMKRKLKLGDVWKYDTDRLFTQDNGLPTMPDTVTTWFRKFIDKRTDLPKIHIHSLRHIHASLLISLGVDIRTISGRLGHSNSSTTLGVYSHFIHSAGQEAARKLEQMLL